MSFKIGDYARVVGNNSEHNFQVGDIVCVADVFNAESVELRSYGVHALNNITNAQIVFEEDIAHATLADKVRNMTNEEMAEKFAEFFLSGAQAVFVEAYGEDAELPFAPKEEYAKMVMEQLKMPWTKD